MVVWAASDGTAFQLASLAPALVRKRSLIRSKSRESYRESINTLQLIRRRRSDVGVLRDRYAVQVDTNVQHARISYSAFVVVIYTLCTECIVLKPAIALCMIMVWQRCYIAVHGEMHLPFAFGYTGCVCVWFRQTDGLPSGLTQSLNVTFRLIWRLECFSWRLVVVSVW